MNAAEHSNVDVSVQNLSWQQVIFRVILIFLVWRCSLFLFDFLSLSLSSERTNNSNKDWQAYPGRYFFDGFFRWDGGWYTRIAERGYFFMDGKSSGVQSNVAFYPLYPYLARYLGYVVGGHHLAGWLISNISCMLGLAYVYRIGAKILDTHSAERACILLLLFPTSLFFSAYYTEGLYLFLSAASAYYFLEKRYVTCGLLGMFAMLCRSSGMTLFVAFGCVLVWRLIKHKEKFRWEMFSIGLIPFGLLIFMLILHSQVSDPFAFVKIQATWGRSQTLPFSTLYNAFLEIDWSFPRQEGHVIHLVDLFFTLSCLVTCLVMWRRDYPGILIWMVLLGVLVPVSTGTLMSMTRYILVLFPAFIVLSDLCQNRVWLERFLFYMFSFFLCMFSLRYMNWFWAG